jgi:ATP-binding cassette subfamily C protein LapB
MIVITHRTSLLALVDRVLVIDNGKVVGEGSVESFLKAGSKNKVELESTRDSTS